MSHPGTPQLGIAFVAGYQPERLQSAVAAADAAGLDQFWLWEDCFTHGGVSTAAVALASSQRIAVGIGLLPAPLRNVALTAMELASLHRLFPGRFIAGVGHGVQDWMAQVGARVASPMTLLREYHDVLRQLLDGRTVTFRGRYLQIDDVALKYPPLHRVPLMLGGRGPNSVRLAARAGDGTLLDTGQGDSEIRQACELIAAERLGTVAASSQHHQVVAILIAATGDGARPRVRDEVARWNPAPSADVGVGGDAGEIAEAILRLARMGVTSVTIQPTEDEPDLAGFIDFLGTEVKPRLRVSR
ncbi:LLM class flavin-dependent oxidoreductase [Mycolicibacterium sp. CBM1]